MTDGPVLLDVTGAVATVTLHRPEARNAISAAMLSQIRKTMGELGGREDIGAIVLTGTDPAFCAGLDLKELSSNTNLLDDGNRDIPPGWPWKPPPQPIIGAINGPAITGGLEFALHCDFLVASERAVFADTHARVGVLPGWGLSVRLPQRVGFAMARRMSFTGDFVDARRALEAGLVTQVVAHDELVPLAQGLAATIAANHRPAILALHESYRRIESDISESGVALELDAAREWRRSGQTDGIGDRVPGVISRGRGQASSDR